MKKYFLLLICIMIFTNSFSQRKQSKSKLNLTAMQQTDPIRYQRFQQYINQAKQYVASHNSPNSSGRLINPDGVIIIPVVVHILHYGEPIGTGRNISDAQIQSQIDVLNQDFNRLNIDQINTPIEFSPLAGVANIQFKLACIDPNGNPTNGIVRIQSPNEFFSYSDMPDPNNYGYYVTDELSIGIKFSSQGGDDAWATDRYLNIWTCDIDGFRPRRVSRSIATVCRSGLCDVLMHNNRSVLSLLQWFGKEILRRQKNTSH